MPRPLPPGASLATVGFVATLETIRHAGRYRDLLLFLVSHLFAMAGLSIVVSFAFIYGDQVIQWTPGMQGATFVVTQVTATVGALGFGWLQRPLGDQRTYALTLVVWIAAVALIRATPLVADAVRSLTGADLSDAQVFLGVGAIAGLCIGATQSAARTLVALLAPPDRVGELFGVWGMFGKLAAIVGLLSLGVLQAAFGLENAIVVTGVFFALGLVTLGFVDVARGREAARARPDVD